LKFTENGSVTIGARVESDTQDKVALTFWVEDTGIGIPPQQLANLFQPFSQADASTARKYGGSGLGLSICKNLIETMMKGKIQLESQENVGTRAWFTVTFEKASADAMLGDAVASEPVSPSSLTGTGVSPAESSSDSDHSLGSNPFIDLSQVPRDELRICIAEDNPINKKIAIQYVKLLGYPNVDAYENGQKAVEGLRRRAAEGRPYHVILMDVQMPILDGYEATKVIRKDSDEAVRKVLIIAMTASAIHGDREKCLAAGMNDYLAKPVRSDVLKKKLEAYVGHSEDASPEPKPVAAADAVATRDGERNMSTPQRLGSSGNHEDGVNGNPRTVSNNDSSSNAAPPSGTSSAGRNLLSGQQSSDVGASAAESGGGTTKRQPRKLVKNRTSGDLGSQGQSATQTVSPAPGLVPGVAQVQTQTSSQQALPIVADKEREKPKGVLTKKPPASHE
jgi:CheY-like chemotaxis protein